MLYTSTRDETDVYTAARTLAGDRAADGGLYVPFRLPQFSWQEIQDISKQSFGQTVAQVLSLFYSTKLTGWDVDFSVGRVPVKLTHVNHRLVVAELWHNPGGSYKYLVERLYDHIRIHGSRDEATDWAKVAVRVSVLFGIFAQMIRDGVVAPDKPVDIAVSADDFALPMAALYGRKMGLPIGMIICGCNANSGLWDLLRRGEYVSAATSAAVWIGHERLIQATLGTAESKRFSQRCGAGKTYSVSESELLKLNDRMYAAVVGSARINSLISSVYKTGGYELSAEDALAYGALQDYRAGNAEGRSALLLADRKPAQIE